MLEQAEPESPPTLTQRVRRSWNRRDRVWTLGAFFLTVLAVSLGVDLHNAHFPDNVIKPTLPLGELGIGFGSGLLLAIKPDKADNNGDRK